jgi:hypothetical protein
LEGLPCEAITRPLREESKGDENDEAMTVSGCSPQFTPGITLKFLLQLKGLADLIELKLYYFILFVTLGMCICQDTKSLLRLSLGDEPSRDSGTNLKIYQLKVAHVDRGDQYHMKIICSAEGKTCTSDGALQAQFPWILLVPATGLAAFSKYTNYHRGSPNVNHAATRLPMYHVVL